MAFMKSMGYSIRIGHSGKYPIATATGPAAITSWATAIAWRTSENAWPLRTRTCRTARRPLIRKGMQLPLLQKIGISLKKREQGKILLKGHHLISSLRTWLQKAAAASLSTT